MTTTQSMIFTTAYASSVAFSAVNEYVMSCSYTEDKKTSFCSDNDHINNDFWRCDKQNYGTWKCGKIPREGGPSLPTDFKKALDLVSGCAVTAASPSKDLMSKKGELSNQEAQINKDQDNSSADLISVKLIVCTSVLRTYRTLLANHLP